MPPGQRQRQSARDCTWDARPPARGAPRRNSSHEYIRHYVHARPKLVVSVLSWLENNLYRNPLDDLDVVARSIFRWQQAEQRSRRASNAIHMTSESPAVRIHVNLCFLPSLHVPELRLFEVRSNPDLVERNHGQQLLA